MYPEDCVQYFVDPAWWEEDAGKDLRRGRLVWANIPTTDQVPYKFTVVGRNDAEDHHSAKFKIEPSDVYELQRKTDLPVAGIPVFKGESFGAYRVKKRPAIIVADGSEGVPSALTRGKAKRHTAPMILVAPAYGCEQGEKRDGYSQEFIDRVRRCSFPQFFWDTIPLPGAKESIIRFDQIQPVGRHYKATEITKYCLSREALEVLDDWIHWYIYESVPEDGVLELLRTGLTE